MGFEPINKIEEHEGEPMPEDLKEPFQKIADDIVNLRNINNKEKVIPDAALLCVMHQFVEYVFANMKKGT